MSSNDANSRCRPAAAIQAQIFQRLLLVKRVFHIDIQTCQACGGAVRIVACIEDPVVVGQILPHLGNNAASAQSSRTWGTTPLLHNPRGYRLVERHPSRCSTDPLNPISRASLTPTRRGTVRSWPASLGNATGKRWHHRQRDGTRHDLLVTLRANSYPRPWTPSVQLRKNGKLEGHFFRTRWCKYPSPEARPKLSSQFLGAALQVDSRRRNN